MSPTPTAPPPPAHPAIDLVAELTLWCADFEAGRLDGDGCPLDDGERFAVHRAGVRAAGLGRPSTGGQLHATDRRARLLTDRRIAREWRFADLVDLRVLGNWGGLVLVHPGGETELVVMASPRPPGWRDATAWLKVEAAFAAGRGSLGLWLTRLAPRIAAADAG
jgi:hypothetical protein